MPEDWLNAAERFCDLGPTNAFGNQMSALLFALSPTVSTDVGVTTSMFDLIFQPRRTSSFFVRVDRQHPGKADAAFRVSRQESRPRLGLGRPGGTLVVGGDRCRPENAEAVVASFLLQLSHGGEDDWRLRPQALSVA